MPFQQPIEGLPHCLSLLGVQAVGIVRMGLAEALQPFTPSGMSIGGM
jgi:hypothetical protein